jgi:hypothetical protein
MADYDWMRSTAQPIDVSLAGGYTPSSGFNLSNPDGLNLPGGGGEGFDFEGALGNFSLGAQGLAGLAGAYNSYNQNQLMKEQLGIQKALTNRNIANQATLTNKALADKASLAAQLTSGAEFGTPEHLAAQRKLTTTVSGAPIA